jgi:hypothetical protein
MGFFWQKTPVLDFYLLRYCYWFHSIFWVGGGRVMPEAVGTGTFFQRFM